MYLHPERVDEDRVVAWLEANGCRDHIALEPITVRGNVVEYTALCRKDPRPLKRLRIDKQTYEPVTRRRQMRVRTRPTEAWLRGQ